MKNISLFKKGFTVLELLIVLFIMTILLSIALVSFTRGSRNAENKTRIANFQLVQLALEEYRAQCKVYPVELELDAQNDYSSPSECIITFEQVLDPSIAVAVDSGEFQYQPLKSQSSQSGVCTAYHLSVELLEPSGFLEGDNDYGGPSGGWEGCVSFGGGIDAVDPWYDIVYGTNEQ